MYEVNLELLKDYFNNENVKVSEKEVRSNNDRLVIKCKISDDSKISKAEKDDENCFYMVVDVEFVAVNLQEYVVNNYIKEYNNYVDRVVNDGRESEEEFINVIRKKETQGLKNGNISIS